MNAKPAFWGVSLALIGAATVGMAGSLVRAQSGAISANATRPGDSTQKSQARARDRAVALDRQARAALLASDRAARRAAALASQVQEAEARLTAVEAALAATRRERDALQRDLAVRGAPLQRMLAGLQLTARQPPLFQLLQPGSLRDMLHLRAVTAAIEPQVAKRTADLRGKVQRARVAEQAATRMAVRYRIARNELEQRRGALQSLSVAEQLKARRAASAADLELERAFAMAQSAGSLARLVRRVNRGDGRVAVDRPAGSGAAPRRLPVRGTRVTPSASLPEGMTLATRPGALVVAPGAGRVAFAGPYRGFGSIVIVEHADGWTSLITGLGSAQVAAGQPVVAGSPLGQAAMRDPRITIELRHRGSAVDASTRLK